MTIVGFHIKFGLWIFGPKTDNRTTLPNIDGHDTS